MKRPRGGLFAAVRGVPTWLRAISTSLSGRARRRSRAATAPSPDPVVGRPAVDSNLRGRAAANAASSPPTAAPPGDADALERLMMGLVERGARVLDSAAGRGSTDARGGSPKEPAVVELDDANASTVLRWLREAPGLAFDELFDLTVVDRLPARPRFEVHYSLGSSATGRALRIRRPIGVEPPEVDSVVPLWRNADWLEREVWDLFGIRFRAHPGLERILLSSDFEGAPLRRDFGRAADASEVAPS
ncbi:MAG: NADH-quinone oxidoreductase subunit C [Myxococcota bacterium]